MLRQRDGGSLWATALHESAHATLHVLEGHSLAEVGLRWEASRCDGSWVHTGGACVPRTGKFSAVSLLAGEVAEKMAGVERHILRGYSSSDLARARALNRRGLFEDRALARRLLRDHWPAVLALADELFERQTLQGDEAEQIIRDHLDPAVRDRVRRAVA